MAHFLMWMANFFTMATFWKVLGFVGFTRKERDFLQAQRDQCTRLCNDIVRLEKRLNAIKASPKDEVLNHNQCVHLLGKLLEAMRGIDKMLLSATKDLKFQPIFEELCYLEKKVEILEKQCIDQENWCHSALFQLYNKETFRELLLDLKCCYDTSSELYLLCHLSQSSNVPPIEFDAPTSDQVIEDEQVLEERLQCVLRVERASDQKIVQQLLWRIKNSNQVDGGDLDALEVPRDFETPKLTQEIGVGSYVDVYQSNWLGLACATKVLKGDLEFIKYIRKEVGILVGFSHPNLVQFLGCGITKHVDKNPKEDESRELHLVMELMETDLSQILKKVKRPLPYLVALDIMHQIAKGVNYLHDMQVAHLDLKPDNILSSSLQIEDFGPHRIFKVTDYGTSELEVCSNPKPLKHTIGTRGYMSPEMIKGSESSHRLKADVWSFAMMCSEILSGKIPYSNLKPREFFDQIKGIHGQRLRPDLPDNCKGLTDLIQECWSQDPLARPTFSEICERLTSLKKSFLMDGSYTVSRTSKSIEGDVIQVNEQMALPKVIQVDLDHQLSKVKGLLKHHYVGIVGMGGIGKTTLAKAIFDDKVVNSSYHASCFVGECKNYQSSYEILCKILPNLGNDEKPKNLIDAQEMMKKLLLQKKLLLILDDVKDETQVLDIVPLDIVQLSKGSTVILTTRQWSTIESLVLAEGRLDVNLMDEEAATTLFTTHLSWSEASFSPNFVAVLKHLVKACDGLPLSLKVMGSFLRTEKRFQSWERALQRLTRGRNGDGDDKIWNTLKVSYNGLSNVQKGMFLDMACFFCPDVYPHGISKETILLLWSKDGVLPMSELDSMIDMSLLKVTNNGNLEMHDQLRDMGRKIAKGTRIWKASMIPNNGFSSEDVEVLEGISWQGTMIQEASSLDFEKLRVLIFVFTFDNIEVLTENLDLFLRLASRCSNLEAIIMRNSKDRVGFNKRFSAATTNALEMKIFNICSTCASLKILDLIGFGLLEKSLYKFASSHSLLCLTLTSCFNFKALSKEVGSWSFLTTLSLEGCESLKTLPKEMGNLFYLTTLNLSWCRSLEVLPKEVGNLFSLTTLNLSQCESLKVLPKEVGNMSSLITLNLSLCKILEVLPKEVGNLFCLTTLNLSWCGSLEVLPKEVGNLSSLTTLNLEACESLEVLPKELGNLSSLTTLNLRGCRSLGILPEEVRNLSSLTTFDLEGCGSLEVLPKEVGNLSSLTTLNLKRCGSLEVLPKEVGNLSSLTTLNLEACESLEVLPKELGNLSSLTTLNLRGCRSLGVLLEEVGNLSSLTTLDLEGCGSLEVLPKEVGNLSSLTTLNLKRCGSMKIVRNEVGNMSSLITLNLSWCRSLEVLPKEVGNLFSLTTFNLKRCESLKILPKEVGNLSCLTTLNLEGCESLEALLKEVGKLSFLTILNLSWCRSLLVLPKEVKNLSFLSTLNLEGCKSLKILPKEVGNLSSLTTLNLSWCQSLEVLPKEIGNLSSLTTLNLSWCESLQILPKEVGNLSSLTTLNFEECRSLKTLPNEVANLSSLTIFNLEGCESLKALPKEVGNLSFLTVLNLEGCRSLKALPKEVGNLSSITTLNLENCRTLKSLPKEIGKFSTLTILNFKGCRSLEVLPKEVGNLSCLTTLNLSWCGSLEVLPKEVGNLSSLTTLNLEGCESLKALPKEVGNFSSLTTLNLKGCESLNALLEEVGKLFSLTTFNLSWCGSLEGLPKEIGNLSSLTTLNLSWCQSLEGLPKEIGNLSSLTTLNLSWCLSLEVLPGEIGNLSSLTTLNLSWCESLQILPKEVGNLSSLTTLNLSWCGSLEVLPEEIGNLSSSSTLNLEGCKILKSLPDEVGNLSSLTTLNLEGCESLELLPEEIGNLSSLTTLNLEACGSLKGLPKELGNLSSLTTLNLRGCRRLEVVPEEVRNLSSLTIVNSDG